MSKDQKSVFLLTKHGNVEVGARPIPSPGSKEVLVKVTAAAKTGIIVEEYPAVLGTDGAGIIESVGPDVTGLQKGDRVFFQGRYTPNLATFQQYVLADSEMMAKIPDSIGDDEASAIPVASVAPMLGLFHKSGVPFPRSGPTASGKPVLIFGGSSSVGQYAIQMARIAGFSPIVTTASEQHTEFLKSLGATHIFDREADAKTLQSAFTEPVSLVLDAISAPATQSVAFEVLTTPTPVLGAHLAVVLSLQEELKMKNEALGSKSIVVNEVWVPFWRTLEHWVKSGDFIPNRVQVVPGGLEGVMEGLELSKRGVSGVKLVIHPQD
ncbi:hypothetical protein FRC10_000916 [Ceratobasidium sp. 414]|nr:hypothetical protein FRC10_000916 [Ceratobasidium sp. 414]